MWTLGRSSGLLDELGCQTRDAGVVQVDGAVTEMDDHERQDWTDEESKECRGGICATSLDRLMDDREGKGTGKECDEKPGPESPWLAFLQRVVLVLKGLDAIAAPVEEPVHGDVREVRSVHLDVAGHDLAGAAVASADHVAARVE